MTLRSRTPFVIGAMALGVILATYGALHITLVRDVDRFDERIAIESVDNTAAAAGAVADADGGTSYRRDSVSLRRALVIFVAAMILFAVVAVAALEWRVLRPLAALTRRARSLSEKPVMGERLDLAGASELAGLSEAVNAMLERLEGAQRALSERATLQETITQISTGFISIGPNDIDAAIREALRTIGESEHAERAFVYLSDEFRKSIHLAYEWTAPGVEWQGMSIDGARREDHPWWANELETRGYAHIARVQDLPEAARPQRELMEAMGIRSALVVRAMLDGELAGFIGFNTITHERSWPESSIALLRIVGDIISNAVARKESAEQIRTAMETAESASEAKSRFLANVSHEIRTPLTGIVGMTDLLLETDMAQDQREFLSVVASSADTLLGLIDDVLDVSRIESGTLELEVADFDILSLVESTVDALTFRAQEKGIEILYRVAPNVPLNLRGDPVRLRQVFLNLLGNAVKFTEEGHVVLEVDLEPIETDDHAAIIRVTVRDSGIGISEDRLESIFDQFSQGDVALVRRYGGTGLGLTICRMIVEEMGGRIRVASEPNKGSTFEFIVAIERAAHVAIGTPAGTELAGVTVLIADSNVRFRASVRELLEAWGAAVVEAEDGAIALGMLNPSSPDRQDVDVVLLAADIPGIGPDLLTNSLRLGLDVPPPIVAMYPVSRAADRAKMHDLGVDAFVPKPVKRARLLSEIQRAVHGEDSETGHATHGESPAGAPGRVLVVEDNLANRELVRATLERAGHTTLLAEHGNGALDILEREDVDLILLDIEMPVMDGYATARAIRSGSRHADVPIIALTAHAFSEIRDLCFDAGMNDFLTKPIRPDRLIAAVGRWLSNADGIVASGSLDEVEDGCDVDAAIPVFDRSVLDVAVDGDAEIFRTLLSGFVQHTPTLVTAVRESHEAGDGAALTRHAHTLKGSAGSYGAMRVHSVAEALETAGREGKLDNVPCMVGEIEREWDAFVKVVWETLSADS